MLGIAICTFNRAPSLVDLIGSLQKHTSTKFELVVCDDGSADNTASICDGLGIPVVTGANYGVSWNKNRGLYWLLNETESSHILLIEDDMLAVSRCWEQNWIAAIDNWGHVNWADKAYMAPRADRVISGDGTLDAPFLAKVFTGCLMGFSRAGLEKVGYFDPSFKGYGYEHIDLTRRFRRSGMGIQTRADQAGNIDEFHVSIAGGMSMKTLPSPSDKSVISANKDVYERLMSSPIFREAWSSSEEKATLLTEIEVARRHAIRRY